MTQSIKFTKFLDKRIRASLGPFSETKKTKTEARNALLAAIDSEPSLFVPRVMIAADGGIWTFFRCPGGWCYIQPSGCMCSLGERDVSEAIALFERHFHQCNENVADDGAVGWSPDMYVPNA